MPKKPLPLPDESTLAEIVIKALSQQGQPKTARDLRKHLTGPFKLPEDSLAGLLTGLVTKGTLFEWPAKGKGKARFWNESPTGFLSQKIVDSLAEKALTPMELKRLLTKQLFGIPKNTIDHGIQALILNGTIIQHPKLGAIKARLGLRPPDPKPYLQKVQSELENVLKMLAPARVSREEITKALGDLLGLYPSTESPIEAFGVKDLENQIISKMVEIEPQAPQGALVSLRNLRRSLSFEKKLFDRTIIDLAKKSRLILHRHSFPQGLSEEERNFLVEDQKGNWYVGAVLMDHGK